ncbi:MAG: hypothetical protein ACPLXM_06035 [Bacteroidales bacterium]
MNLLQEIKKYIFIILLAELCSSLAGQSERLIYHDIKTDPSGKIIPWYSPDPGKSYSHIVSLIWDFWDKMRRDINGTPYYMNHQIWDSATNDPRGIGGDQIQMALSSWRLLYQYSGNQRIRENMKFMADYYISNAFSTSDCKWPDIPFPYNTLVYSGKYDGDMILGKGFTQPDKAGSFGIELVRMYKMFSGERYPNITDDIYLETAVKIANTLAARTNIGDENNSPLPFKVNVFTGETGRLINDNRANGKAEFCTYTSNWTGTMELFLELCELGKGDTALYKTAFTRILNWMKKYPLKTNKWGPFFEDVPGWSDTQINAITFARFIMDHHEYFPEWKKDVEGIFNWVYKTLGNRKWEKYGVVVINEQTAYQIPGNSHTARQASAELQYVMLSGDTVRKQNAIRQLNWATYMVDADGKNLYPQAKIWLTDGYGDYVRHYLRAMSYCDDILPLGEDHIISSSSVVQQVDLGNRNEKNDSSGAITGRSEFILRYSVFDLSGTERILLAAKPSKVRVDKKILEEGKSTVHDSYEWKPLKNGGILTVHRINGNTVTIYY